MRRRPLWGVAALILLGACATTSGPKALSSVQRWADEVPPCADSLAAPAGTPAAYIAGEDEPQAPVEIKLFALPRYPYDVVLPGDSGTAVMRFIVNAGGCAEAASIAVVRATHPALGTLAGHAVRHSQFHPAMVNGRPVRRLVIQSYGFQRR